MQQEQPVDQEAWRLAQEQGVPLREARRSIGNTPREFIECASAMQDVEDARRASAEAALMRRLAVDAGLLEVPAPSDRETEVAARMMRDGEDPADVRRAVRAKCVGIIGAWNDRPGGRGQPLTSYDAILQAARDAVAAAITVNTAQQQGSAAAWMDASEPAAPAANPVGGDPSTL